MSLGKLSAIKGLVSVSDGKRRFRSDLSVDMISPPLGDFRHTMHIGHGGDVFGDTSFLSNHGGPAKNDDCPDSLSRSRTTQFLSRTLRHVPKHPPARLLGGSRDLLSSPPPVSPIITNAISLPQLNLDPPNGGLQEALLRTSASSPADSLFSYGLRSAVSRLDEKCVCGEHAESSVLENMSMTASDSLSSFTLDLGPSLMTEVLGLIDSSGSLFRSGKKWDMEEEEEPASCTSAGSPQDDGGGKRPVAGASLGCPFRVEVGIEPRRFQQAANMLERHFGGSGLLKEQKGLEEERHRPSSFRHGGALPTFTDADEELTV